MIHIIFQIFIISNNCYNYSIAFVGIIQEVTAVQHPPLAQQSNDLIKYQYQSDKFNYFTDIIMEHQHYQQPYFKQEQLQQPLAKDAIQDEMLTQECKKIIQSKEKIEISGLQCYFAYYPYMIRLILTLYYSLYKKLYFSDREQYVLHYLKNPLSTYIKYTVLKLLTSIIQKRLFLSLEPQKYYEQISFALIFKQCIFSLILSIISENKNLVIIQKIIHFYQNIVSEEYFLYIPVHIYHLYGGGTIIIEAKNFAEKVKTMIESMGKVLSNPDTIINRNIDIFQNNEDRKLLLNESIKIVMLYKNKATLLQVVNNITNSIFNNKSHLTRQQFLYQLQSKPIDPLLTNLLLMIRAEILLMEDSTFKTHISTKTTSSNANFYATSISKMLKKCPFNGDDQCSCNKCVCVRRNRNSAKLNQQKKRSAVVQVQGCNEKLAKLQEQKFGDEKVMREFQEREDQLQRKGRELFEQNNMLRSLLREMGMNGNISQLFERQGDDKIQKIINRQ